ncbi:MAG TPA: hypothetical protein VKD69_19480 [Vicinamibacterales bacterium]|nr:hypothetical protein [Vicinamibacterales bacterium]
MPALDNQIDNLYQLPLAEFTTARNALAKTLKGDESAQVKALAKPTVVAWAANQLYWHAREAFNALMKSGERVRKAQIAALQGKDADIRGANDEHRRAVSAAVAEAERLADKAGSKPSSDGLTRTFEAMSLTPHPPDPPGRLTEALQPASGFEALAGVTPIGLARAAQTDHVPAKAGRDAEKEARGDRRREADREAETREGPRTRAERERDRKQVAREREEAQRAEEEARAAAAERRRRQAELEKADAAVARAEASEKLARASWEHAHDALLDARRKRDEIRKSLG